MRSEGVSRLNNGGLIGSVGISAHHGWAAVLLMDRIRLTLWPRRPRMFKLTAVTKLAISTFEEFADCHG